MTLCCCWPCSIFEALPCRMSCCQLCNQKCINQWPAEPFADFLVMASRHDLGGVLQLSRQSGTNSVWPGGPAGCFFFLFLFILSFSSSAGNGFVLALPGFFINRCYLFTLY